MPWITGRFIPCAGLVEIRGSKEKDRPPAGFAVATAAAQLA